ncbi:MAG: hypothetical protein JOS17DRAFT_460340 [Linnemannia elongata]|nr:MAG: hypothetical protein JOS17DRAFT_460340 [Linnemannia elongata]
MRLSLSLTPCTTKTRAHSHLSVYTKKLFYTSASTQSCLGKHNYCTWHFSATASRCELTFTKKCYNSAAAVAARKREEYFPQILDRVPNGSRSLLGSTGYILGVAVFFFFRHPWHQPSQLARFRSSFSVYTDLVASIKVYGSTRQTRVRYKEKNGRVVMALQGSSIGHTYPHGLSTTVNHIIGSSFMHTHIRVGCSAYTFVDKERVVVHHGDKIAKQEMLSSDIFLPPSACSTRLHRCLSHSPWCAYDHIS